MTKRTSIICNRCRRDQDVPDHTERPAGWMTIALPDHPGTRYNVDLCPDCVDALRQWVITE